MVMIFPGGLLAVQHWYHDTHVPWARCFAQDRLAYESSGGQVELRPGSSRSMRRGGIPITVIQATKTITRMVNPNCGALRRTLATDGTSANLLTRFATGNRNVD